MATTLGVLAILPVCCITGLMIDSNVVVYILYEMIPQSVASLVSGIFTEGVVTSLMLAGAIGASSYGITRSQGATRSEAIAVGVFAGVTTLVVALFVFVLVLGR